MSMQVSAQGVRFYSEDFANAVRYHIGLDESAEINASQLDTITVLDLSCLDLTDIRDLLYIPNVKRLNLEGNKLENVAILANLEFLSELNLCHNQLESINELVFSRSPEMTVDVAFNYIQDFSCFNTFADCCFTIEGTGFQSVKNAPYFDVRELHAELMVDDVIDIYYRGYTNMSEQSVLKIGMTESEALMDGDIHHVSVPENTTEVTPVTLSNGKVSETTYVLPPKEVEVEAGQTIILETGLPDDYRLAYVHVNVGTFEIVGNALKYTAPTEGGGDVIDFCYYQESTLKGISRFYINGGEVTSESITISKAKQVPYYSKYNLNFTDKPELKAYVATGYDKAKGTIWLTRVKQVPAETGFLLTGEEGDYEVPVSESASDCYYKNMFKGTLEGTTLYTTDGDYTNYYLSKGDAGVGFYKVTKEEGVKVGANRCYLPILTEIPANGSEGDAELIKVTAAKQVPYYTSKNLDFTTMEAQGVKAYTATGYNYNTGVIWLTRVKKVPAQTGILVMADGEGEYNVPTTTVQSVYENMFVGSETAQTIYTNEEIGGVDYVNYYLSKGDAGVGFYKVTNPDGVKMGANRCYLPIPKRDAASGARGKNGESSFCNMILSDESNDDVIAIPVFGGMNGEDDGTTGIDIQSSIFNLQSNEVYYNLQGQRVENPRKGIYIKNGRKVVIK